MARFGLRRVELVFSPRHRAIHVVVVAESVELLRAARRIIEHETNVEGRLVIAAFDTKARFGLLLVVKKRERDFVSLSFEIEDVERRSPPRALLVNADASSKEDPELA